MQMTSVEFTANIQAQLPAGWQVRTDPRNGRVYYVDHHSRRTQWESPVPLQFSSAAPPPPPPPPPAKLPDLPDNWEERTDPGAGRKYYVDHNTRTTHWVRPMCGRQGAHFFRSATQLGSAPGQTNISYRQKYDQFQRVIATMTTPAALRTGQPNPRAKTTLHVTRDRILESSVQQFLALKSDQLRGRLLFQFVGEEGKDWGGLAKEWFHLIIEALLKPELGLFRFSDGDTLSYQINARPTADQLAFRFALFGEDPLAAFKFTGALLAKAIRDGQLINAHFTRPFYKMLLNRPFSFADLEVVDSQVYSSLVYILDNPVQDIIYETFSVQDQHGVDQELKKGGAAIDVGEDNKEEYVELYANWIMHGQVADERTSLNRAFHDIVPLQAIQSFDYNELELLMCGLPDIDVDDWEANSEYTNFTVNDKCIKWFWQMVRSWDHEKRALLLQFVTGTTCLPAGGFKDLSGAGAHNSGPIVRKFKIRQLDASFVLPRSHTCFNVLDIPNYKTKAELEKNMEIALTMGAVGFGTE